MAAVYKICVLKKLDEKPELFVSIPKGYPNFDGFKSKILERFPELKTQQFCIFYRGKLYLFFLFLTLVS